MADPEKAREPPGLGPALGLGLLALVLSVVAANAWLCDDAFITLRSVKHLVGGQGPVFNVGWRVQSYTHPAWMLILALAWALTREAFWTTLAVSLAVTGAALGLGLRGCRGWPGAVVFCAALVSSRAFVEFSTSGLENPLTHLIVIAGARLLVAARDDRGASGPDVEARRVLCAGLLVSAAFLARPDAVLLLAPVWLAFDHRARVAGVGRRARLGRWCLAAAPALAWIVFALVYYGSPVPNTAIAKLGFGGGGGELGPTRVELIGRGLTYVGAAATTDPVTFVLVLAAILVPWLPWLPARVGAAQLRPLASGAAAYLVYVVAIGGDFMEGRFLTAIALIGALALAELLGSARAAGPVSAALLVVAALGTRHPLEVFGTGPAADRPEAYRGIADERSHYVEAASVMAWRPGRALPDHDWRAAGERGPEDGRRVVLFSTLGFYGYHADSERHVVDAFALADPFLARIPPVRRVDWKAGHRPRIMPEGYLETLAGDPLEHRLVDPELAGLYVSLAKVHRGPLFAAGRGAAIWALLTGRASAGIDLRRYALAELVVVDAGTLARRRQTLRFRDAGVELRLGSMSMADPPRSKLDLRLSPGQRYVVVFRRGELEHSRRELEVEGEVGGAAVDLTIELPGPTIDRVHILPATMHGQRSLEVGPQGR